MAAARVVVVGGGIVGATAAWQLARRGVAVDLVESAETGRATSAGAGIVQPWRPAATGSWAVYSDLAGHRYPELAAELATESGCDPSYAAGRRPDGQPGRSTGCGRWPASWRRRGQRAAGPGSARSRCWRPAGPSRGSRCWTAASARCGPRGPDGSTGGCSATPPRRPPNGPEPPGTRGGRSWSPTAAGSAVCASTVASWRPTSSSSRPAPGRLALCAPLGIPVALGPMRGQIAAPAGARTPGPPAGRR